VFILANIVLEEQDIEHSYKIKNAGRVIHGSEQKYFFSSYPRRSRKTKSFEGIIETHVANR